MSVLQPWVEKLSLMQQSVLLASIRGPDGLHKNHVSKNLLRWFRRCILISAFDKRVLASPHELGGGSFTGPVADVTAAVEAYLKCVDEVPHHFQLHLMHAAEIVGYKHPVYLTRVWWYDFYRKLVNDAHLYPESEAQMDKRLGDVESQWREREEVVADQPEITR